MKYFGVYQEAPNKEWFLVAVFLTEQDAKNFIKGMIYNECYKIIPLNNWKHWNEIEVEGLNHG